MGRECNQENMRKFINALESGQYAQGGGRLRIGNQFCCLGVACDQAVKDGAELRVRQDEPLQSCGNPDCTACGGDEGWVYDGQIGYLPESVQEWLGIDQANPAIAGASATWWNDAQGASFSTIGQLFRHEFLDEDNPHEREAAIS